MSLEPTPGQTVGPYFTLCLPWEDGPVAAADGVRIAGRVLDGDGGPVPDALVETWDPVAHAFARCASGDDGAWHVATPPAPFLAVNVLARGLLHRLVTRIYFDESGIPDAVPAERRHTLVARREGGGFRFDIRLQGEEETVFFDV